MEQGQLAVMIPMVVSVAMFATIFGIVYLRNREKMAMIERGMDPRAHKPYPAPYRNLTWGLLLLGAGLGTFIAYLLNHTTSLYGHHDSFFLYISLIAIFGGLGLFTSYRIEKKEVLDKNPQYFE